MELNPDVHGDYVNEDIEQVLENNPEFMNTFSIIVATELKERTLIQLSNKLWELDIPFLNCRSYGFLGYIRIQLKEHTVIESHPENQTLDLRLDKPFPTLVDHINSIDLNKMELKDHAHVPYLIILFKYLEVSENISIHLLKIFIVLHIYACALSGLEKGNWERFS